MFETPILFIVFNRPRTTRETFEVISKIKPAHLYVAADGPRADRPGEKELCDEARRIAINVNWECKVKTLFRESNLGCGPGPFSAISWFFENVEEGIILEDDLVPDPSFFNYCEELLAYYRDNPRVMHISGDNYQYGRKWGKTSYYFSRFTHNTGWATWRRAWRYYDFTLTSERRRASAWDAQWQLSVARENGVAILPNINLIKNIGFGDDATHTKAKVRFFDLEAEEMTFPLIHPKSIRINRIADLYTEYNHIQNKSNPFLFWGYVLMDNLRRIKHWFLRAADRKNSR
jgi:hypothetical protein